MSRERVRCSLFIKQKIKIDPVILAITLFLCVCGATFVYSASCYVALKDYNDAYFFLKKQVLGYVVGLVAFFAVHKINLEFLKRHALKIFAFSLLLLALVLTPLGKEVYGAKRWISLGAVTIQPSEISKFAFVLLTAAYFSKDITRAESFKGCIPVLLAGGVTCALIMAQPNMSVTVCIGAVMLSMLFIAGFSVKKMLLLFAPIVALIPLLIIVEPYRLKRLSAFLDPWASPKGEGYQLIQSLYALGSGGLFGVGIFNSRQKFKFLPFAESDFILSVIGEETGFFGVFLLLASCVFLTFYIIKTAIKCKDFFSYLTCMGIALVFIIQVAVNALVVTGSIPPTGIPFPLISSGNTQIIVFMSAFGCVSAISTGIMR